MTRRTQFTSKLSTSLWAEEACEDNPFVARRTWLRGHCMSNLTTSGSWVAVWFLLFGGDMPTVQQAHLLERLMIGLLNPGTRDPASRAAITAAASMSRAVHLLPIGGLVLGGAHLGGEEAGASARFLEANLADEPSAVARRLQAATEADALGDRRLAPGFGTRYGSKDPLADALLDTLLVQPAAGPHLEWLRAFRAATADGPSGPLFPAVTAACLLDLGFSAGHIPALYQLLRIPGVLAHGLEYIGRRPADLPFLEDEDYVIEP